MAFRWLQKTPKGLAENPKDISEDLLGSENVAGVEGEHQEGKLAWFVQNGLEHHSTCLTPIDDGFS